MPDFWPGLDSWFFKKNTLSSGYHHHMGHLALDILKWYSTTEVMLVQTHYLTLHRKLINLQSPKCEKKRRKKNKHFFVSSAEIAFDFFSIVKHIGLLWPNLSFGWPFFLWLLLLFTFSWWKSYGIDFDLMFVDFV